MRIEPWTRDRGAALALALLLAGGTAAAQTPCQGGAACIGSSEASISVSETVGSAPVPGMTDLTVPAFDVTLGSLARVDVRATIPVSGFFATENLDPSAGCPGGTWTTSVAADVTLVQGGIDVALGLDLTVSSSFGPLGPYDGVLDYGGLSGETNSFMQDLVADACFDRAGVLDHFRSDVSGPDLTFTFGIGAAPPTQTSSCGFLAVMSGRNVGVQIEVTYTYCVPTGTAFCSGDGSGTACPCGNTGDAGHGCANASFASGAILAGSGDPSVSADSLVLSVLGSTPGEPGLFFQGDDVVNGGLGLSFGDGLRCAGGVVVRIELITADPTGSVSSSAPIAATGGASAGDLLRYQWWYRDPTGSPCGGGFNLSNGFEVTWTP